MDINENGNFKAVPSDEEKILQDDELFHRSRLVNCGYFMKVILGGTNFLDYLLGHQVHILAQDYVGAILGLVKYQSSWRFDPLMVRCFCFS